MWHKRLVQPVTFKFLNGAETDYSNIQVHIRWFVTLMIFFIVAMIIKGC